MDPAFVIAIIVLGAIYVGNRWLSAPRRMRRGYIETQFVPRCRLSPAEQRVKAAERNLVYQGIEEAARRKGEIDAELFGRRMRDLNLLAVSIRPNQAMPGVDGL